MNSNKKIRKAIFSEKIQFKKQIANKIAKVDIFWKIFTFWYYFEMQLLILRIMRFKPKFQEKIKFALAINKKHNKQSKKHLILANENILGLRARQPKTQKISCNVHLTIFVFTLVQLRKTANKFQASEL